MNIKKGKISANFTLNDTTNFPFTSSSDNNQEVEDKNIRLIKKKSICILM